MARVKRVVGFVGESLTVQSEKDNCDINTIVKRFGVTGIVPGRSAEPLPNGTYAESFDLQSAMNVVRQAQESFDALPARVRERFHNDPVEYVDFLKDKDNLEEARKLGMVKPEVKPPEPPAPMKVEVVNPNPPPDGKK